MSLTLLVGMVVVGISAVVAAVHYTGGSRVARFDDEDAARRRFADDFPDHAVRAARLTAGRDAAFLELAGCKVGVVQAFGGKFLTRIVTAGDLAVTPRATSRSITVRFRDFTWRGSTFAFEDEEGAEAVEAMFKAVRQARIWEEQ